MKEVALLGNFVAEQEFKGIIVRVEGNSNLCLISSHWQFVVSGYLRGPVGPHPKAELFSNIPHINPHWYEFVSDQGNWEDIEEIWANEDLKARLARDQVEREFFAELRTCPPMSRDEARWQEATKTQGYGWSIYTYAEYWARLMEKKINQGQKLNSIEMACAYKADIFGGVLLTTAKPPPGFWRIFGITEENSVYGKTAGKPLMHVVSGFFLYLCLS